MQRSICWQRFPLQVGSYYRKQGGDLLLREATERQREHSLYRFSSQKYGMMSCRFQMWTAVAETGSCVHSTNAQLNKTKKKGKKRNEIEVYRREEGEWRLLKIFNPPSINSSCRDENTTCTVDLKRERKGGVHWGIRPLIL